jgi:hypothetical protein
MTAAMLGKSNFRRANNQEEGNKAGENDLTQGGLIHSALRANADGAGRSACVLFCWNLILSRKVVPGEAPGQSGAKLRVRTPSRGTVSVFEWAEIVPETNQLSDV